MIDANRPLGLDPTLTGPQHVQHKPVTESGPTPQTSAAASTALQPHDASATHVQQATHLSVAATNFQPVPEASVEDTFNFVFTQQDKPITSLAMVDTHVLVASGGHLIRMKLADLENAMSKGNLRPDSALGRALVLHEEAVGAGLSAGATRAIMKSYSSALASGQEPRQAHLVALTNISTAVEVEAYVANKTGLASDVRRVAEFTKDAFDSNAAGGTLAAIRNRTLKAEVIKQHQGWLDTNLHGFTDAFATARETGDYAQAFDQLQTFFAVSAKVTDTDYWKNRPQTVLAALEPPSTASRQSVAPTRFADMLSLHASPAPAAKPLSLPTRAPQAAEGGFFSNLYARIVDFFQTPPTSAGTGDIAAFAARGLQARLSGLEATACTGQLYRAPDLIMRELEPSKIRKAPTEPKSQEARSAHGMSSQPEELFDESLLPDMNLAPSKVRKPLAEPSFQEVRPTKVMDLPPEELQLRLGVPKVKPRDPGAAELKLREKLYSLKVGDSFDLAGTAKAGIGVELNAIDFIPVAGQALSEAGVKAAVSASLAAGGEKKAQMTLLEHGRVAMKVLTEIGGGGTVGAEAGFKPAGLSIEADASVRAGRLAVVEMTFNSVTDAARWLAHPRDHGGLTQGDTIAADQFTATSRVETYTEYASGSEATSFVSSAQKSSLSKLPGMRTTVTEATARTLTGGTGDTVMELNFRLSTHAGKSSDSPVASEVTLTALKVADRIEEPAVDVSLNITKLMNMTKLGSQGGLAREIILDKMAERLIETLEKANGKGFDKSIDTTDVRDRLDAALRTLQDQADAMFKGEGVTQQSQLGAMGLSLLRGDLAKLTFKLEAGADGRLHLGPPAIGVEGTTRLKYEFNLNKVVTLHAEASVAATSQRAVETGKEARPVMPRQGAATGTDVPIHSVDAGYFYAIRQPNTLGKATLTDPVVSLKMDYTDLVMVLGETGSPQERKAAVDTVIDRLVRDLGPKAQAEGLDAPIDREGSLAAFRQALGMLKGHYDSLMAGADKTNYTVPFEDFAVRVRDKTYKPFSQKGMLDFRLEKGANGYVLKPPLDNPVTAKAVETHAADVAAKQRRQEAAVSDALDVTVDGKGFLQARLDEKGECVPLVGLKASVEAMYARFEDVAPVIGRQQDKDYGIKKWADQMLGQMDEILGKARSDKQFVGNFDRAGMRASLLVTARSLRDMQPQVTGLGADKRLIAVGDDMQVDVAPTARLLGFGYGGHELTLQFRATQSPRDGQWRLPMGSLEVQDAVTAHKDPVVSAKLDVTVKHVGYFKAVTNAANEPVPALGLQVKADELFRALDMPPPSGSMDPEFGIKHWAQQMLATVESQFLAPSLSEGTFLGRFDRAQMLDSLIEMGQSLQGKQAEILGLDASASKTYTGADVAVHVVPRNEAGKGHKLTLQFTASQPTFDPNTWRLPSGTLTQ